jgi:hypothetical protein
MLVNGPAAEFGWIILLGAAAQSGLPRTMPAKQKWNGAAGRGNVLWLTYNGGLIDYAER